MPSGENAPTSKKTEYSPYEQEAIDIALKQYKLEREPVPEGKTVGKITSVRLDVLEPRDPGPELLQPIPIVSPLGTVVTKPMLNWLHITTKEFIIRRELLLKEGDPYSQVAVDETARNMRSRMTQVSLVIIQPVKSAEPGKVDLLVLTKDIWSLRLSFNVVGTPGGIEDFVLVPQETNFLGLQHTLSTNFRLQPNTIGLGVGYNVPRFGYSWVGAGASAGVVFNRLTGSPEGSSASLAVSRPLYSTRTEWAWDASVGYNIGVARTYSNAQVELVHFRGTPQDRADDVPYEYRTRSASAETSVTRSFGWKYKNNFTLAANGSTTVYKTYETTGLDPVAVQKFRDVLLPKSEDRIYPSLTWHTFENDYLRTLDITTLGLQEDYRLGHDVSASVYPVAKAVGSTRNIVGASGKVGYAIAIRDGFVGASASTFAEQDLDRGKVTDGAVSGAFGAATPRFGFGRFVMNISATNRYANYLNSRSFLGGSDRLRGYPTNFLSGKDTVLFNWEYRSAPVDVIKLVGKLARRPLGGGVLLGGVVFFDAGDAEDGWAKLNPKQSVGVGARVLLPQINRPVFRFDLGFPIQRGPFPDQPQNTASRVSPVGFFFSFDQAFSP